MAALIQVPVEPYEATLCTGHKVFHVFLPVLDMPLPLVYGEGVTPQQAVDDLNAQLGRNKFADIIKATLRKEVK